MLTRNGFAQLIAYIQWIKNSGDGHQILPDYQITHIDNLVADGMSTQAPNGRADAGELDNLLRLMHQGTQKIEAIKVYRNMTGAGLKESKDAVERYWVSKLIGAPAGADPHSNVPGLR